MSYESNRLTFFPPKNKEAFFFIFILLLALFITFDSHAADVCKIKHLNSPTPASVLKVNTPSELTAQRGVNQYQINCSLENGGVLSFLRPGLDSFTWQQKNTVKAPLKSGQVAYLMDSGTFTATITLESKLNYTPRFKWQHAHTYFEKTQQDSLIMGSFYGLCITLIFYVLIMGHRLNESVFKLYSIYIFCIGSFILLQEGQLYLFVTQHVSGVIFNLYLLSIGLTVLSATWFMLALLETNKRWPRLTKLLKALACAVMLSAVLKMLFTNLFFWTIAGYVMSYCSLFIVAVIFTLAAMQAFKGVREATLVFVALSLVLVSMIFRVLLINQSPFMQRYGFVLAFAVESFLLAVAVSRRISRMRIAQKRAETEADYDPLCSILNRRGWAKKSSSLLDLHTKKGGVLCLMYIDLDDFKQINDTYGHAVGDDALCKVATCLKSSVRSNDAVGRLGGDEFVVLAHFYKNAQVSPKTHHLKTTLNRLTINHNNDPITIKASVGTTIFSEPPHSIDEILKAGDTAMYHEKLQRKVKPLTLVDG
ncbi:diguanylate cyclase [Pseudoalteromonas sp. S3785]|uniref:sensor domain-containing diguanylate cyclase n=1 Tax=Pseudoalteromonas sp. S3785 TaxID=579545 RepID=UPI00110BF4D7|nr:diguanylate cyclase [Pseudoalteromonas sp. S3785]TMO71295.1 diguanylate cyclase [Pseudoalteromonas sp. S3785]